MKERLYGKRSSLFQLDSYFRHAALVTMKLTLVATVALLTTVSFVAPVTAQDSQPMKAETPTAQAQVNGDRVLQTCVQEQANTLPNPFPDVSSNHWAYKAVLSMYYCGAYRGSVPSEQVKSFLQQTLQPTSNLGVSEWRFE
ncbi:hypothetical protein [Allocoleopsis sp.]|uniref:hypothetical protein n=1 Tax=Allocoleopsis sp. TaxID=3088169 RepID=UPI002FD1200D